MQKEQHFSCVIDHQEKVKQELATKTDQVVTEIQSSRQTLAQSTDRYDRLTPKLSGLLDEMKTLVDETRTESMVKLRSVHSDLEAVETQINANYANHIGTFNEFKTQMMQKNATITNQLDTCLNVAKQIKSDEAEIVRMSTENEAQLVASLNEMNQNYEAQKSALIEKVNSTFGQVENTCEMTRIDIDGGLNGIVHDVSNEQDRIDAHQFENDDIMNTLLSTQNEFHEMLNTEIAACQTRLDKFQSDELQLYTPTGQTPAKREYKYPKALAVTSPHGKIFSDFWRTHNPADLECSAIISEVGSSASSSSYYFNLFYVFTQFYLFFRNCRKPLMMWNQRFWPKLHLEIQCYHLRLINQLPNEPYVKVMHSMQTQFQLHFRIISKNKFLRRILTAQTTNCVSKIL